MTTLEACFFAEKKKHHRGHFVLHFGTLESWISILLCGSTRTTTWKHHFTASDAASEPWRAPQLSRSSSNLLALKSERILCSCYRRSGSCSKNLVLPIHQEESGSGNCPNFCLLTVEVEEAMWPMWPSMRPIYTKRLESLAEVRGVRLNPPGCLFVHIVPSVCFSLSTSTSCLLSSCTIRQSFNSQAQENNQHRKYTAVNLEMLQD